MLTTFQSNTKENPKREAPKIVAVMSADIGGMHALEPLVVSARTVLPLVDSDGMGRGFSRASGRQRYHCLTLGMGGLVR